MVRRLIAASLAAALILLSPGSDAGRAFAAVLTGRAPVAPVALNGATVRPLSGVSLAAPAAVTLPTILAAPSLRPALAPTPAHSVPAAANDAPKPADYVPAMAQTLAPALEAAADVRSGASADRGNAQHIEDVITGQRSIAGAADLSVAGSLSAGVSGLSAATDAPAAAPKAAPEAPKAAPIKVVASRLAYAWHRFALSAVASLTGAVHSMPAAGPALVDRAVARAADKRVVFSDFDDTLAAYNQTLSPEMIDAIRAVKAAGKEFVVISDRGDEKRAHQLTVFESLETMPVELRAGMYVAANSGGRVYRYDEQGVPQRVYEMPALADANKAKVSAAAEATKARMTAELGVVQHVPSEKNNNPSESWNTYGYAMMLQVGANETQVRGAATILQEELAKQGIDTEVKPRFAKDPANPPYINFSIVTKQPATEYIAKALKATAQDVVIVGDSMYDPREAKKPGSWLDRMGAKLSGRALPKTGNATDRNMERALPGALTFAVGHNADPRMSNVWVTGVKGPESTRRMLLSVASRPAGAPTARGSEAAGEALSVIAILGFLAAGAAGFYFMLDALAQIMVQGEQLLRERLMDQDWMMMLGGAGLVAGSLKAKGPEKKDEPAKKADEDKPMTRGEKVATGVFLAAAGAASLYLWYMLYAGFTNLPPTPVDVPPGWQGPIPNIRGIEDIFGAAGLGMAGMLGAKAVDYKALGRKVVDFLRPAFPFFAWLGLASLTAAIYAGFYWAFTNAPAAVPAYPVAPGGWEQLFQGMGFAGAAGLGLAGWMSRPQVLVAPGESYPAAWKRATELAAARGVAAKDVLFVQATAVMPLHQGKHWNYEFALPRQDGAYDLVYVDFERSLGGPMDFRSSVYENVKTLPEGGFVRPVAPHQFNASEAYLAPGAALDKIRAASPSFGSRVSVSMKLDGTTEFAPWYRVYDERGGVASVNARTGEVKILTPSSVEEKRWNDGILIALVVIAAGLAASFLF